MPGAGARIAQASGSSREKAELLVREEVLILLSNKQAWIMKNLLGIPRLRAAD